MVMRGGKLEEKSLHGRIRRRYEDNIKIDFKEIDGLNVFVCA
jgi:hypothetical protein